MPETRLPKPAFNHRFQPRSPKRDSAGKSSRIRALEKRQKIRLLTRLCIINLIIGLACIFAIFSGYFLGADLATVLTFSNIGTDQQVGGVLCFILTFVSGIGLWLNNRGRYAVASRIFTYVTLLLAVIAYYFYYDLLPLMLVFMLPIALSITLLESWETILMLVLCVAVTLVLFVGESIAHYYTVPIVLVENAKLAGTFTVIVVITPAIVVLLLIPFKNQISLLQNQNNQLISALNEIESVLALAGELKSIAHLQNSGSQEQAANIMQLNTSGHELSSSATQVSTVVSQISEASQVMAQQSLLIERTSSQAGPILAEQEVAIAANDLRAFHRTDERFHAALAELSGFPGVWPIIQQAKTQMDRYRQLTLPLAGRMAGVLNEHRAVVAAIEARDPARAVAAMREHLDHVMPVLELTRKLRPEFFTTHLDNRPTR